MEGQHFLIFLNKLASWDSLIAWFPNTGIIKCLSQYTKTKKDAESVVPWLVFTDPVR